MKKSPNHQHLNNKITISSFLKSSISIDIQARNHKSIEKLGQNLQYTKRPIPSNLCVALPQDISVQTSFNIEIMAQVNLSNQKLRNFEVKLLADVSKNNGRIFKFKTSLVGSVPNYVEEKVPGGDRIRAPRKFLSPKIWDPGPIKEDCHASYLGWFWHTPLVLHTTNIKDSRNNG